jgi:hypothetical protein
MNENHKCEIEKLCKFKNLPRSSDDNIVFIGSSDNDNDDDDDDDDGDCGGDRGRGGEALVKNMD